MNVSGTVSSSRPGACLTNGYEEHSGFEAQSIMSNPGLLKRVPLCPLGPSLKASEEGSTRLSLDHFEVCLFVPKCDISDEGQHTGFF
jgi:hypothetical protein